MLFRSVEKKRVLNPKETTKGDFKSRAFSAENAALTAKRLFKGGNNPPLRNPRPYGVDGGDTNISLGTPWSVFELTLDYKGMPRFCGAYDVFSHTSTVGGVF